jgi:hypothetical protein
MLPETRLAPRPGGRLPACRVTGTIGETKGPLPAAEQPELALQNLPLANNRHAILNFSLIVPPTLGRNAFCSSQSPQSNVTAS